MALAVPYLNQVTASTVSTILYTAPTTGYHRDIVIENAGVGPLYVGSFTAVTAVTGLQIPSGGQLVMHGPTATNNVWGILGVGTTATYTVNVGYASVVSVI